MIFVTVGTHEQAFDRLIKYIDELVQNGIITEEVVMQTGYCKYNPKKCKFNKIIGYKEMMTNIKNARIVITHGGPASFILPLQCGKIPIVVPRRKKFGEHVNDHQFEFCKEVENRQKNIIVVEKIEDLEQTISNYSKLCESLNSSSVSNNAKFNEELKKIIDELMG